MPNDTDRCPGVGSDSEGWREGCEDCLRRTSPTSAEFAWHITPPAIIAFECEYRIEPNRDPLDRLAQWNADNGVDY